MVSRIIYFILIIFILFFPKVRDGIMARGDKTKDFEGFESNIYLDTAKKKTIGYGFNIEDKTISSLLPKDVVNGSRPLTEKEANPIFHILLNRAENDAKLFIGERKFNNLSSEKQEVLTDMAYNLGLPKLMGFEKFKEAVIKGDDIQAAEELVDSKWFKQVGRRSRHHVNVFNPERKF